MSDATAKNTALYNQIFGDTQALFAAIKAHPQFQQAVSTRTPTRFRIVVPGARDDKRMNNADGGWDVRVDANGQVSASNGGIWKPLGAAAAVAAVGMTAGGAFGGGGGAPGGGGGALETPGTVNAGADWGTALETPGTVNAGADWGTALETPGTVNAGADWGTALETPGTVNVGGNVSSTVPRASSGLSLGKIMKWAAPVGSGIVGAIQQRRQANQQAEAERQRQAVTESRLDPFRGYMQQARDASSLDRYTNTDYTPSPTQLDPKYGAGLNLPAPTNYGPSPETRAMLRAALAHVSGGDAAPQITPGTQPMPVVRRKKNPLDDTSWLYQ